MNRRNELIEKMGVHLESKEQLAPLAARILANLVLKGRKGETFENLVCDLKASKSTIFTHLTTLQASHRITYYTKPGDRKKYFILSPNALIRSMDEILQNWKDEREIHIEIVNYKKDVNKDLPEDSDERFDLGFHNEYLNYLEQAKILMENLRTRLIENHNHH
ncbi:GbsR/MarR family transcriptional regulator [Aequorivita marina]|uniref:GbsR/MarR family transcriptional regulator n=1 Tax=Aequorivita marina TaxID=3073654 RepID=UPI0028762562|nr:transcriptional regulator [Aequorivita sp. S2608]MDS1298914.1 transcriptional regulator [Aequorivita sp. S2608]